MAQLDKILQSMIQHRADELLLCEDEGAVFKVDGAEKPVTKSLTGPQGARADHCHQTTTCFIGRGAKN